VAVATATTPTPAAMLVATPVVAARTVAVVAVTVETFADAGTR
jgi:hypothetical protein